MLDNVFCLTDRVDMPPQLQKSYLQPTLLRRYINIRILLLRQVEDSTRFRTYDPLLLASLRRRIILK